MKTHRFSKTIFFTAMTVLLAPVFAGQLATNGWTPELSMKVKRVSHVQVSPDARWAAFEVATAVMDREKSEWLSQVHLAHADGSGSFQLTQGDKSSKSPAWSPDGRWVAFLADRSEKSDPSKEKPNLWRIRVEGGEAEQLTNEKGGITVFEWSPDGSQIAFLMPEPKTEEEEQAEKERRDWKVIDENLKMVGLYVMSVETNAEGKRPVHRLTNPKMSIGSDFMGKSFDWSPDSRSIVFAHHPSPKVDEWTKSDLSVVEVRSGNVRPLATSRATEMQPKFSPDGRWIAYTASDVPPTWGFTARVQVIPAAGGVPRALADTYDRHPTIVGWMKNGQHIIVTETYHTVRRLTALPVNGGSPVDLTPDDFLVDEPSLSQSLTHIGFASQSPERAVEPFVSRLDKFEPMQIAQVQNLPASPPGKTEVVTWKAPDGKIIEGLLTYPVGYQPGVRVPLLVIVHGGPSGVFVRSFIGSVSPYPIAAFASRGYAVLRCNVRGSSGYGREFRYANYKDWGGGDYRDIMSGVDALIANGIVDADRLGIMGWSYGGFMTSWVITQTKRFKAASVGAGVTNLLSFAGTADIPSFIPDYFGGEYWDVFDVWRAHSAIFNVKGVSTPTLIQHGEADKRVPVSQGYELYNALKRQGAPAKMVVYPRQPHGLRDPKFILHAMESNLEWYDRWLGGKEKLERAGSK